MALEGSTRAVGATIWLTGLSGAGKSTVAAALAEDLRAKNLAVYLLDGDDLREGLNSDLGFSAEDRAENVRRVGEVALLFARAANLTIVSLISPYAAGRDAVRSRHAANGVDFIEVHVATGLALCEQRDPKGLYSRARAGEIDCFTGVSDPYEEPVNPELKLLTENASPKDSAGAILALLVGRGLAPSADPAR